LIKGIHDLGDVTVVELSDRVDAVTSPDLKARLHGLIAEGRTRLVINLRDVVLVDSSGLGMLVSCLHRCVAAGGELCLAEVPEFARNIFEITRLTRVFRLAADETEAVEAVKRQPGQ
jgi:anti-anti-sigma factor